MRKAINEHHDITDLFLWITIWFNLPVDLSKTGQKAVQLNCIREKSKIFTCHYETPYDLKKGKNCGLIDYHYIDYKDALAILGCGCKFECVIFKCISRMGGNSQPKHLLEHGIGHYDGVRIGEIGSQITNLTIVYSTVYSGTDQSKHQSWASLAFVWEIHRRPVNSPHKWPVTRKMFPFDDVFMSLLMVSQCCVRSWFGQQAIEIGVTSQK